MKPYKLRFLELAQRLKYADAVARKIIYRKLDKILDEYNKEKNRV